MTTNTKVTRVATWTGWCTPCQSADRPLVLTRTGPAGLRAWLTGRHGDGELLLLTCTVCGQWQVVPSRETDEPESAAVSEVPEVSAVTAEVPAPLTAATEVRLPGPVVLDLTDEAIASGASGADLAAAAAALSALAAATADPGARPVVLRRG